MYAVLLIAIVMLAIPVRPDRGPPPTPPAPVSPLLGHWRIVKVSVDGLGDIPEKFDDKAMQFTPTEIVSFENGVAKPEHGSAYTIDWKQTPAAIDFIPNNGGGAKKIEAILKIEGDRLTICFAINGKRPSRFDNPAGAMNVTMVLQRSK